ncbi:MAG: carboxypeptidase regulatory-like domain-containing protein [Acidobacteria bacterium]|nr:carboxypeptidase regulatory-like domain-containing protein [Acidobacteriota bacterium]
MKKQHSKPAKILVLGTFLFAVVFMAFQVRSSSAAEDKGSIYGTVTVDKGDVVGFRVKAKDLTGKVTYTVFTRRGRYRVPNLPSGPYEIWVNNDNFDSLVQKVELKPGERLNVDLALKAKPNFKIENQFRPRDSHTLKRDANAELVSYDELYPAGPGRDLLELHCFACHGTLFHNLNYDEKGWRDAVDRMTRKRQMPNRTRRGNVIFEKIPEKDIEILADYLVKSFPKDRPSRDLKLDELRVNEDVVADALFIEYDVPPKPGYRPRSYHDPYIAPDGGVWANDRANSSLLRIDPDARKAEDRVAEEYKAPRQGTSMHGIVIDSAGIVYYADTQGGYLGQLNPKVGEFRVHTTNPDPDETMVQIAVDSKDNVWMGLISGEKIGQFIKATNQVKLWDIPSPIDCNPYGLIVSSDDKMYAAGISCHSIIQFDPVTEKFTLFRTPTVPSAPRRLGEDKNGLIWWGGYTGDVMGVLDPKTGKQTEYKFPLKFSRGYDAWPIGEYVWLTESTYEAFIRFEPKTKQFVYYPLPTNQPGGNPGVPKMEYDKKKPDTIWFCYRGLRNQPNPMVAFKPKGNAQPEMAFR